MIKTNKVGVEMLQILSRNGNNAIILCRCPNINDRIKQLGGEV